MNVEKRYFVTAIRLASLAIFLCCTVSISVSSVLSFLAFIGSIKLVTFPKFTKNGLMDKKLTNPYKGKPHVDEEDISDEILNEVNKRVTEFVTYDARSVDSLHNFGILKENSECIFAKKAKIWGSPTFDEELNIETNVQKCLPTFLKFSLLCEHLGLDGFLYELPSQYGKDIETFGEATRQVLCSISSADPQNDDCMSKSYIDRNGWVFKFNKITFFITTFAPCYPETHPRFNFGSQYCYILLQPEISFAQHDLPDDTPHTNWDKPVTVRDRIRVAFRTAGREYKVRDTIRYPMVHDIVKPVDTTKDFFVWWKAKAH